MPINTEEVAKQISQAFAKELEVEIPYEKITEYLLKLKKFGITNEYTDVFEADGKQYLIRINGKLWPPYKRETEAHALNILKQNGIETNVLFNGDIFQICKAPAMDKSLKAYLTKSETNINEILSLIAKEIVKYQKLLGPNIVYPISNMLDLAVGSLDKKLEQAQEILQDLKLFSEVCKKIIMLGDRSNLIFCHSDLDSSSVFIDLTDVKVTIIDWEYAATAYWSNDLAMLGRFLNPEQLDFLANEYYRAAGLGDKMPALQSDFLRFNRFILKFLYEIVWKINSENVKEFEPAVADMKIEAKTFIKKLDEYLQTESLAPDLPSSQSLENRESFSTILKQPEEKTAEYSSIFKSINYGKRKWMPSPEREQINKILDDKMSTVIEKLQITVLKPHAKYLDKLSNIGWQLFLLKEEQNQDLCLAVLNVEDLEQAKKLIDLIKKSDVTITAKSGKTENQDCVIISFPYDANKSNTIEKLGEELDKIAIQAQTNQSKLVI